MWEEIETAPEYKLVWCFEPHGMGGFMFSGYKKNNGEWINNIDFKKQNPTHWQILPVEPNSDDVKRKNINDK